MWSRKLRLASGNDARDQCHKSFKGFSAWSLNRGFSSFGLAVRNIEVSRLYKGVNKEFSNLWREFDSLQGDHEKVISAMVERQKEEVVRLTELLRKERATRQGQSPPQGNAPVGGGSWVTKY